MSVERPPWYKRPLSLPRWLPGWLLACVLTGVASAVSYHLVAADVSAFGVLVAFAFGFGFMLAILTMTASKSDPKQASADFLPPPWVRHPVWVALFVGIGALWVSDQRITTGARHGGHVLVEGPAAIAVGVATMLLPAVSIVILIRRQPPSIALRGAAVVGLLIIAAGLIFAAARVIHLSHHA